MNKFSILFTQKLLTDLDYAVRKLRALLAIIISTTISGVAFIICNSICYFIFREY